MKSILAALAAAAPLLMTGPAHAAAPAPGSVVFAYDPPNINEEGTHVSWHWKLTNQSGLTATQVTLRHHLNPPLDKITASAPCTVDQKGIRCHYDELAAGASKEGTVEADLPSDLSGTVQINGRITWQSAAKKPDASSAPAPAETPAAVLDERAR